MSWWNLTCVCSVTVLFADLSFQRIHSWGNTLEEAFEQCAMAMFGYMTDTETVEPINTVDVESEGESSLSLSVRRTPRSTVSHNAASRWPEVNLCAYKCPFSKGDDMESLLFHFLDDWLYKFSADLFFVPRVSMLDQLRGDGDGHVLYIVYQNIQGRLWCHRKKNYYSFIWALVFCYHPYMPQYAHCWAHFTYNAFWLLFDGQAMLIICLLNDYLFSYFILLTL